jgi:hypothetical protein
MKIRKVITEIREKTVDNMTISLSEISGFTYDTNKYPPANKRKYNINSCNRYLGKWLREIISKLFV